MDKFSYLKSSNAAYIDELFSRYASDPDSVDSTWRYFFDGLELGSENNAYSKGNGNGHAPAPAQSTQTSSASGNVSGNALGIDLSAEAKVAELILAYRSLGKHLADIDPLNPPTSSHPLLELSRFGLGEGDLGKTFSAGKLIGLGSAKLSDIVLRLKDTYCRTIAVEFMHIENSTERDWLQKRMEQTANRTTLTPDTQKFILKRLTETETFERFIHARYVAQKRFSVEGGDNVIPSLDCIIESGAELGAKEIVLGMAHRGRLNVLAHIFGKKTEYIFTQFEDAYKTDSSGGEGDVKYHMGYSADVTTRQGKTLHLSMASNPSHLEIVSPVVEGVVWAKQHLLNDATKTSVVPVLIHGDAAFAGQGVCYETLNLSQLEGYGTGGTIHIVINNQVGFTTSPSDSRSTPYCTDLAKMLETPIFHVNGDDAEAVWHVSQLCAEYRQKFKKDVFIDLVCYRKHGHNEGDEPSFTQPMMYKQIKTHASPREIYGQKLLTSKIVGAADAQAMVDQETATLAEAQARTKAEAPAPYVSVFEGRWKNYKRATEADLFKPVNTAVPEKTLRELSEKINHQPAGFHLHPKLNRFFEGRMKAVQEGKGVDWGNGEALAYASLLNDGVTIRLSGQDAERGTFTHRHSVLNDFETGDHYCPFNQIREGQGHFYVYNSHLSESGVMGFEYGVSLADPSALVIWEAQFGDFANGAQIVIDQFLASGESKWQRMSGLVLLLPHGYEGQGAEHSSARLERFLQLAGRQNLFVCNFTTPAQLFHAFRRQVRRDFRKPLVIMSPKSLLRHPMAVSKLEDLTEGGFQEVLDDPEMKGSAEKIKKVLLCSGKVYYDLLAERAARKIQDIAILRVEQLYPWPATLLTKILAQYSKAKTIVWTQEEPRNMGAWSYVFGLWMGGSGLFLENAGGRPIHYLGREAGASPAVGSHKVHEQDQKALIDAALSP